MKTLKSLSISGGIILGILIIQFCHTAIPKNQTMKQTTMTKTTIDRATKPTPGPKPHYALPETYSDTLENGLKIQLVRYQELPVLVAEMIFQTGSAADPVDQPGLANLTANLLDEGTTSRSSLEIAEDIDYIGADLQTGSTWDYSYIKLNTLTKHLDSALTVFDDILRNPTFPREEFARIQQEQLNSILQRKDNPSSIATQVFYRILYTDQHPYGNPSRGTESSVKSMTREDLINFWKNNYRPNNATLVVVGNITMEELLPKIKTGFGDWKPAEKPFPVTPEVRDQDYSNIYVVDKPNAPQSQIRIGHPGLLRNNPDYAAVQVMNEILGGAFSSRINLNLREDKGYTYGARSQFVYRKGLGPFLAYAGVKSNTTDSSVVEFMKEIRGISATEVTDDELSSAKSSMILSLARDMETPNQILDMLVERVVYQLPENYLSQYVDKLQSVDQSDVQRVAKEYIHPDNMAIVIVGDVSTIETGLDSLHMGKVIELDNEGNPVE